MSQSCNCRFHPAFSVYTRSPYYQDWVNIFCFYTSCSRVSEYPGLSVVDGVLVCAIPPSAMWCALSTLAWAWSSWQDVWMWWRIQHMVLLTHYPTCWMKTKAEIGVWYFFTKLGQKSSLKSLGELEFLATELLCSLFSWSSSSASQMPFLPATIWKVGVS